MSKEENTIFISHSSKDVKLIKIAELAFENLDIKPYFAKNRIEGKNPVDKIVEAISNAKAFFSLITPNVINDVHTRDWVSFEIGVARANEKGIFVWIDTEILKSKSYPRLIENVADYSGFDCKSDEDCLTVIRAIRGLALNSGGKLSRTESNGEESIIVGMEEAQKIAREFVISQKKEYTDIEISSSEPKPDGWIVQGTSSRSTSHSYGSYHWTVIIRGKTVFSYDFKVGPAWAIG